MSSGNISTVNKLQQLYSNNVSHVSGGRVPGHVSVSPGIWIQEVITPVMIILSCLVLGIAAVILILLVKHYRYESETNLYHPVIIN